MESHSFGKVLYSSNNKFFYLVGYGFHSGKKIGEDTSFVLIAKIDTLGNLIFAKTYTKFINDKPGFIYFSDAQLDSKNSEETTTFWGFLATMWVPGWLGLFYPYILQFDANGNKIFENFDTTKGQTLYIMHPGVLLRWNDTLFTFAYSNGKTVIKRSTLDANFISEQIIDIPGMLRPNALRYEDGLIS